jgi:arylsulfatase A-like enzyme
MATSGRNRLWLFLLFVIVIIILIGTYLALTKRDRSHPNILWITMDSLRYDHLGCAGYDRANTPTIDALAQEGIFFDQCVSQATYTHISVPSMITSKYPYFVGIRTLVPDVDSSHVTLAETLNKRGYFTCAIPEPWTGGFFQGFQQWQRISHDTRQKTDWCLEVLDQLDTRPFFIWLYYWDPHAPYQPPSEFMRLYEPQYVPWELKRDGLLKEYDNDKLKDHSDHYGGAIEVLVRSNSGIIRLSDTDKRHLMNLYDAEISYVDAELKRVFNRLKELNLWENTLIVLNADHGESFGKHGRYYHGTTLYEPEIRVPFIIKPPQNLGMGKVLSGSVRNLDIFPTILDYCHIDIPKNIQGKSLRSYIEENNSPHLPSVIETNSLQGRTHLIAYRTEQHKLICNLTYGKTELYNLVEDPQELTNLLAEQTLSGGPNRQAQEITDQLQQKLLETLQVEHLDQLQLQQSTPIDRRTEEKLRALGYLY